MDDIIQNVTDVIGDAYKYWAPGSMVIIPSYVGSGKTHFIFNELARLADEKNKIVYLCNRKALLDQVIQKNEEKKTIELSEDTTEDIYIYNENIYILSYQYCESTNMFPNIEIPKAKLYPKLGAGDDEVVKIALEDIRYFIYEEAQYFATDIAFNEKCSFWAKKKLVFENSTSIFMTATPEPLYCFLALYSDPKLVGNIVYDICNTESSKAEVTNKISNLEVEYSDYMSSIKNTNNFHIDKPQEENVTIAKSIYRGDISISVPGLFNTKYNKVVEHVEKEPADFFPYLIEKYTEEKKKIKEYSAVIEHILRIISSYEKFSKKYNISRNHDNYDCYYFEEYNSLFESIINSSDRWIVFVDSEADGRKLEATLNALFEYIYDLSNTNKTTNYYSPYAVFLSRETIKKKRSPAFREYQNIIDNECFNCKVLLATKLLDNGVNLDVKSNINNIVISQANKTEFIQMLGRVRTIDHKAESSEEKIKPVKLYIRNISYQSINGGASQRIADLLWVKSLVLSRERQDVSKDPNSFTFGRFYSAIENKTISPVIKRDNNPFNKVGEDLYVDLSYLAYCLYDIYQFHSVSIDRKKDDDPDLFYLKKQLSWIGKSYDAKKWVGVQENIDAICDFLSEFLGKEWSCKNAELLKIKATIVPHLLKIPLRILPSFNTTHRNKLKESLRDYKNSLIEPASKTKRRNTIIKCDTLNKFFKDLKIPYIIDTNKTKSKNWWRVVEVEITTGDK